MEFGECPYCDKPVFNYAPEDVPLPVLERVTCENCEREYFIKHSRIDPEAYTLEEAAKRFPDMKSIKPETTE